MEIMEFNLNELHAVQVEMLKKLITVCNNHGFTYYLAFGSLLGAVREHKVIPWDDSIDIVMPFYDYEKLTQLPQEIWGGDLFMQTYYTDPQYPKYYAKLRNSRTTLIKADYADCDINQGIYIIIMPLINLADNQDRRMEQLNDAKLYKSLTEKQSLPADEGLLRFYSYLLLEASSEQHIRKLKEELKAKVTRYEGENTKECFVLAGNASLTLALPKTWFESAVKWEFEGLNVNIPKGWHEWLTLRYGNYMVTPISDLQGDKISKFVKLNTQRSYIEYKGKAYCVNS